MLSGFFAVIKFWRCIGDSVISHEINPLLFMIPKVVNINYAKMVISMLLIPSLHEKSYRVSVLSRTGGTQKFVCYLNVSA